MRYHAPRRCFTFRNIDAIGRRIDFEVDVRNVSERQTGSRITIRFNGILAPADGRHDRAAEQASLPSDTFRIEDFVQFGGIVVELISRTVTGVDNIYGHGIPTHVIRPIFRLSGIVPIVRQTIVGRRVYPSSPSGIEDFNVVAAIELNLVSNAGQIEPDRRGSIRQVVTQIDYIRDLSVILIDAGRSRGGIIPEISVVDVGRM